MNEGKLILVVAVMVMLGAVLFAGLQAGYISNRALLLDGSNSMEADLDMAHNYIIESDFCHWIHVTMEGGKTDVTINMIPSGVLLKDRHYHRVTFAVDTAPGSGKSCSVSLSDGTSTITVTLSNAETSGYSTTNSFDWDASAETLTLSYSQDAGGSATKAFITIKYHYKENE